MNFMAREINFEEYNNEVLKSDKLVLIDFFATWCGPCKMLAPVIEQVSNDHEDVMVVKVDVDKNPELAVLYKVASIPTLVFLKEGKCVKEHVGFATKAEIEKMIEECK
ncbi:MAG: thioredoxin [Lachnospiraceae bacterium]|nr:thioredoxin [Lachnospiraceae bacterium]MBQ2982062.1 thioredoxin [Lachnospiraceae bacterium]